MFICFALALFWLPQCWLLPPACLPTQAPNKRFFLYNGSMSTITIGSSDKVTHNVTSNILAIILQEILGYSDVQIVNADNVEDLVFNQSGAKPKAMINLEIWLDIDLFPHNDGIEDTGMISPLGRVGWFVRNYTNVTWLTFMDAHDSSQFSLNNGQLTHLNAHCQSHNCSDEFTPVLCANQTCAILLVDANEWPVDNVAHHITQNKLYVKVKAVSSLAKMIFWLTEDVPLLVLAWEPDEVTAIGEWHPVIFPACNYGAHNPASPGCQYAPQRLVKYVSSFLAKGAPPAYQAVRHLELERKDQFEMLRGAAVESVSHYDLACQYLLKNERFKTWKQETAKLPLRICGIFPLENVFQTRFSALGLPAAAQLATEHINSVTNVLPNHNLIVSVRNGQCNAERVVKTFIEYVLGFDSKEIVGVLGPACSDSLDSLVSLTTHFRTAVISYSAEGSIFSISDRNKYPYFFRTIGENLAYQQVYLKLMQRMHWKRMGALTEHALKYSEYLTHLHNLLRDNGIVFENLKFVRSHVNASMKGYIKELQEKRTRIIVADVDDAAARAILCDAYKLKMTAKHGYVWFLPHWLSKKWYDVDSSRAHTQENIECTSAEMKQAIRGYFSLSHRHTAPNDTWLSYGNTTVKGWKQMYSDKLKNKSIVEPSTFASYVYDAVWTYAIALDKLYRANPSFLANIHTLEATQKYVQYLQETDFIGVSGRIRFAQGPSRTSVIDVKEWYDDEFHVVGSFDDTTNQLVMNASALRWLTGDGQAPEDGGDGSSCAVQQLADVLGTSCTAAIVIANVVGLLAALAILVAAVVFYKRKYEKRIGQMVVTEKYMKQLGFDLIPPNISDLDRWEVAREDVVINRKLGEGAFGTVYGGEVRLDSINWVPAAVKTLKASATTDEKLDFLGEAELMKRFDHKNIVKLLGVSTRKEPVYTIMEFMLYGDFRSFLQNRRHLVSGRHNSDESNEVSSKKLTSFALDIARGLGYLASQKFVHRDIACRNCLLNSAKVAKIGDFGLTRRMYESDYYKFSRRGMLPIRWMSPESLADGLFTCKSDVWAFGVVIYEIVTFGSYPFPGMSNNEVMDYVISGNTINIPKGAKPQLEGLLKSCWNFDKDKRPDPADLVVFLASNPRALTPCLEEIPMNVGLESELLDIHLSAPCSPLNVGGSFFADVDNRLESESSRASPEAVFDSAREALLPESSPIEIQMSVMRSAQPPSTLAYHDTDLL